MEQVGEIAAGLSGPAQESLCHTHSWSGEVLMSRYLTELVDAGLLLRQRRRWDNGYEESCATRTPLGDEVVAFLREGARP